VFVAVPELSGLQLRDVRDVEESLRVLVGGLELVITKGVDQRLGGAKTHRTRWSHLTTCDIRPINRHPIPDALARLVTGRASGADARPGARRPVCCRAG
jgi:hypothetical protein